MTLPLTTTTITVKRTAASSTHDAGADEPLPLVTVATGVPAQIGSPSGREDLLASAEGQAVTDARLLCDPVDGGLTHRDQITDETTGQVYEVVWQRRRAGLGLDHEVAGLRRCEGVP